MMAGNFVLFAKHTPYSSLILRNYCMDITRQKEHLTLARWLWDLCLAHLFLHHLWAQWVRALQAKRPRMELVTLQVLVSHL